MKTKTPDSPPSEEHQSDGAGGYSQPIILDSNDPSFGENVPTLWGRSPTPIPDGNKSLQEKPALEIGRGDPPSIRKTGQSIHKNVYFEELNAGDIRERLLKNKGRIGQPTEPNYQPEKQAPLVVADFGEASDWRVLSHEIVGQLRPIPTPDALVERLVQTGLTPEWAKKAAMACLDRIAEEEVAPLSICEGPEKAPCLYVDRPKGMTPPQFLKTYYGSWLGNLSQRKLKDLDPQAFNAINTWKHRYPDDPELKDAHLLSRKDVLDLSRSALGSLPDQVKREVFRQRSAKYRKEHS